MQNLTGNKRKRLRIIIPGYPAFNIYSFIASKTTALGPICVASAVNEMEGWDVEVIDENNLRRYGPRGKNGGADHEFLQSQRPADVVGFYGGLTSTIPRLYELARFYKARGVTTIAGGQHFVDATIPEAFANSLDYLVIGEGEQTIKELLAGIEGKLDLKQIKGIVYRQDDQLVRTPARPAITDFEALPLPDFSLLRYAKIKMYPVERIRGCGMHCEFCTVKGKPRAASANRLLESMKFLLETHDARHFFIVDDLFGQDRLETIRFCAMLRDYQRAIGRRLDTTVQIRLDKAKDSELLKAMREAGINTVAIGYESPIEEELQVMDKRVKAADMIELTKIFHAFGFLVHGMFIFGYPAKANQSFSMPLAERVRRYKAFIWRAQIDTIQVLLPVPLPGTELTQRLKEQNRVYPIEDVGWQYYDGNFPVFNPDSPMTAEAMQDAIRKIMGKFYRFRSVFMLGLHILSFPALIFFLHNIRGEWKRWYQPWRNSLVRVGGWVTLRRWTREFKKDDFSRRIQMAKHHLKKGIAVVAVCAAGCLCATNACAFDAQERTQMVNVYNLTVDLYSLVVGLFNDLSDKGIEPAMAEEKISEWQNRYGQKTESVPSDAQQMCGLMSEMLDLSEEIIDDYEPMNIRTKDQLKALEKLKTEVKSAMTELRYKLK